MSGTGERSAPAARITAAAVAGALAAGLAAAAVGFGLSALGVPEGTAGAAAAWRGWLASGGWAWMPLWGGAAGLLWGALVAARGGARGALAAIALASALLPWIWRPEVHEPAPRALPRTRSAKTMALRRWAFRGADGVSRIVMLSRDSDPLIREQAMLSLGVNEMVADLEQAVAGRPSRYLRSPLRARVRDRLVEALGDPDEAVRAEAARALWKAPRAFGAQPAAADTLAAVLDRGLRPGVPERLSWLALDAAAGSPWPPLRAAAARFAAVVPDSELARAARRAAGAGSGP